jgi:uncharacterized membrane protein YkvA (DUF1232 family)
MKHFDQLLQEDIAQYEGRHDQLIFQAPAFYRLMVCLLDDPRLPAQQRGLVIAAIAYFILPVDIIPEEIEGPYGYVDDLFFCAWVAGQVLAAVGEELLVENWDGEGPIAPLVKEILGQESDLIGDKKTRILAYVGLA